MSDGLVLRECLGCGVRFGVRDGQPRLCRDCLPRLDELRNAPCVVCGRPFYHKQLKQNVCSAECKREYRAEYEKHRDRSRPRKAKKCLQCGRLFTPAKSDTMLCSQECRNARHAARRRKPPERTCPHCGVVFRPATVQRRYCSPECVADAKAARVALRRTHTYHKRTLSDEERLERALRYTPKPDPTPEEIAERCLAIQATWTEAEERERRAWQSPDVVFLRI